MAPNLFDFALLIFLIACYFLSSLRGGSKQIFSLAAIIFSFVIAGRNYWDVGKIFPEKVFPESFAGAIGFVAVFLLVFGVVSLIGRFLDGIFKQIHFGGIDRFVSITIGILKGLTLGCLTFVIIMVNYPADAPILTNSITGPYIFPAVRKFAKLLPKKEQKEFFTKETDLRTFWEKNKGKNK
jgi:uncharacterized membrane protein required for colicin V production